MSISTLSFKIYFHPEEIYFPSSTTYYSNNSFLINNGTNIPFNNQKELLEYNCQNNRENVFLIAKNYQIKYGENIDNVPIYYFDREYENLYYKTFVLFFPYSGPYKVLGIQDTGEHWGDLEHFTFEYDKSGDIKRLYFAGHGDTDGRWMNIDDVEMEGKDYVLYNARHSHAFYPTIGIYLRNYGFTNDITDKGLSYTPKEIIHVKNIMDMNNDDKLLYGMLYFCGKLGEIDSLNWKGWYNNKDVSINPPLKIPMAVFNIINLILLIALLLLFGGIIIFGYNRIGIQHQLFYIMLIIVIIYLFINIGKFGVKIFTPK